jgi:hypothetical protein
MKAIQTRFIGPTNTKGARIQAWVYGMKPVVVPYDYEVNAEENHRAAAVAFTINTGWELQPYESLHMGALPNGDYAHVFKEPKP